MNAAPPRAGRPTDARLVAAALVLALAALAALPLFPSGAALAPARTVVLVDVSASVRRPRPDHALWVRGELAREAREAHAAGREIAVASYATRAAQAFAPADAQALLEALAAGADALELRVADDEARRSDLAQALAWARAALGADDVARGTRAPGRLVLLSDGAYDGADPRPRLAAMPVASVAWFAPPSPVRPDAAVLLLELPADPAPGAPLIATLELAAAGPPGRVPRSLEVELVLRAGSQERRATVDVELDGADDSLATRRVGVELGAAPAGSLELVAIARLPAGSGADAVPENDRASARATTRGLRRFAIVAPERVQARLGPWLDAARLARLGLAVERIEPARLAVELPRLDAVATFGLAPADLPEAALAAFVEAGGGWLGAFDTSFLALEVPSALSELAPLEPAPVGRPPRDVVLLVDASGSMSGEPYRALQAAALALLDAVPAGDRVLVQFFTGALLPAVELGHRGERARAAERLLSARPPSGPTALLLCVEAFARERERAGRPAFTVLLSDGREEGDPPRPEERAAAVVDGLAASGVEFVAVALGSQRRLGPLLALAPGRVHEVADDALAQLSDLLVEEVAAERFDRRPTALHPAADGALAARVAGAARAGSLELRMPARAARGGEVFLRDDDGAPVAAVARRGAGRVAVLAGGPFEGHAEPEALAPEGFAPLLAFLAERPRPAWAVRSVDGADGAPWLEVGGLDSGAPALLSARLVDPRTGVERARVELEPPAGPGGATRRRARWPALAGEPRAPLHVVLEGSALDGGALEGGALDGGAAAVVDVGEPSAPPTAVLVEAPLPDDLRPGLGPRRIGTGDLPRALGVPGRPRGPHAALPSLLALGLGLGVWAALSRGRERRRSSVKVRSPVLR